MTHAQHRIDSPYDQAAATVAAGAARADVSSPPAEPIALARRRQLTLRSIDDYLGNSGTRFFGAGHRRVRYELDELATDGTVTRGAARVAYPTDWSTKATGPLRPHLSTIDALVLGADVAEQALRDTTGEDAGWLRRVDIRAGTTPYEDGLDRVPVAGSVLSTGQQGDERVSVVQSQIANMAVSCEIVHGGERAGRPLYGGYRGRRQSIDDMTIDLDREQADATVTIVASDEDGAAVTTPIDAFVVTLQMGQVLLYEIDGVDRADSNTLWMRHTTITSVTPPPRIDGGVAVTTSLSGGRIVTGHGGTWRTATVVGEVDGLAVRCAVAHELPAARAVQA